MFTYKNYTYEEFIDRDDEKSWYVHEISTKYKGRVLYISVDYSKHHQMTEEAFKTLVDLNFPDRPRASVSFPWTAETLRDYKEELEYAKQYTIENESLSEL